MSKYFVLWSGGFDSTYLVDFLLQEPTNSVRAAYCALANNADKTKMEMRAIDRMTPIFKTKYGDRFEYAGKLTTVELCSPDRALFPLVQAPVWLFAAAMNMRHTDDYVAIGYVSQDCAVSYLEDFKTAFNGYRALGGPGATKFPELVFPLSKFDKDHMVDWFDDDLMAHTVWCEDPQGDNYTQCGCCSPCKRAPLALMMHRVFKLPKNLLADMNDIRCSPRVRIVSSEPDKANQGAGDGLGVDPGHADGLELGLLERDHAR